MIDRHIKQPATAVSDATTLGQRAADNEPAVPSNATSAAVVDDNNPPEPAVRRCTSRPSATEQGSSSPTDDAGGCISSSSTSVRLRAASVSEHLSPHRYHYDDVAFFVKMWT